MRRGFHRLVNADYELVRLVMPDLLQHVIHNGKTHELYDDEQHYRLITNN